LRASKELNCKALTVVTWDHEGVETHGGGEIKFVPLWKWLLGRPMPKNHWGIEHVTG